MDSFIRRTDLFAAGSEMQKTAKETAILICITAGPDYESWVKLCMCCKECGGKTD